ncbi:TolC family protein [Botrimarina sp.]|uniref:TolC family protein n=1 Tax=Botrimarina sp. TaxID=2795802 RepID=UPI0032EC21D3
MPSLLVVAAVLAPLAGCSRTRARVTADRDAYCLIDQKSTAVGGDLGEYRLAIEPRSRMYDENDPDHPPMPPDDPVSHRYLHRIDGKKGTYYYRDAPRTPFVENPSWRAMLPVDERGRLVLDTTGAVRVGLVHDPDYQQELEELYLSALDVAFERFQFDVQLFGGAAIDYVSLGRVRGGGASSSQLFVSPSSAAAGPSAFNPWRLERTTALGGEIVASFANTLVWQFSGQNNYTGFSLLDFTMVQPLLRGGGRVRVLEVLTVAERALLANVRSMERFQREYYVNVVTGRGTGSGPVRRGGLLGGAGIANFAGVGLGIGGFGGFGGGGIGGGGEAGAQAAGGYLGLLQTRQVLANQRANVAALRDSTLQLEASYDAGRIDRFQVDLARQALFNAQSQLLNAEAGYQTRLDGFKIDLGLPPDLELVVDDPLLESFELLSPDITEVQDAVAATLVEPVEPIAAPEGEMIETAPPLSIPPPGGPSLGEPSPSVADADTPAALPADGAPEAVPAEPVAPSRGEELRRLVAQAAEQLAVVEEDYMRLQDALPERREHLIEIGARPEVADAQIDASFFSTERLDERASAIELDLGLWREAFAELQAELDGPTTEQETRLLRRLSSLLLELSILQARTRLDSLDLAPTRLTPEDALEIASVNRRDWANARASLVDQWRLINFNANDLRSALDIVFSGDIGNVGQNPFDLNHENGSLRVGLQFDSPTSRLGERNVYRQSLIEYQQARRSYYQFVDRVSQSLRATLRQIRLNEVNFELRREAVLVAIAQVDLTQLRLVEPPRPGEEEQFGDTTARDLVQALGDLLSAQNDLLSVWVNNRVQRFNLELDLGIMMIDSTGMWVPIEGPYEAFLPLGPCPGGGDITAIHCPPVGVEPKRLPPALLRQPELIQPGPSPPELTHPELTQPAAGAVDPEESAPEPLRYPDVAAAYRSSRVTAEAPPAAPPAGRNRGPELVDAAGRGAAGRQ